MTIMADCLGCGRRFGVDAGHAGGVVLCPGCSGPVRVPNESVFVAREDVRVPTGRRRTRAAILAALLVAGLAAAGAWGGFLGGWGGTDGELIKAGRESGEARALFDDAGRALRLGDADGAVRGYRAFLAHPGATAFARLAGSGGGDAAGRLAAGVRDERARAEAAVHAKDAAAAEVRRLVLACVDPADPDSVEAYDRNFAAACAEAGLFPGDPSSPTVAAYRAVRALVLERARWAESLRAPAPVMPPGLDFAPTLGRGPAVAAGGDDPEAERRRRWEQAYAGADPATRGRMDRMKRDRADAQARPEAPAPGPAAPGKPRFSLVAETLMGRAKALEKARKLESAVGLYRRVAKEFPGTEQALAAGKRAAFLGKE